MRIAVCPRTAIGRHGGAFRIAYAFVELQAGCLRLYRHLDSLGRIDVPGMVQIEIPYIGAHEIRIRQAGVLVTRSELGERAGLGDRLPNRGRRHVRCAGTALARVFEHGDPYTPVVCILQALNIAQASSRGQSHVLAGGNLRLVDTQILRFIQCHRDEVFKFGAAKYFAFCDRSHNSSNSLIGYLSVDVSRGRLPPPDRGKYFILWMIQSPAKARGSANTWRGKNSAKN